MRFPLLFAILIGVKVQAQVNLSSGLVLCLPLNGNATDYSPFGNHGTISGATPTVNRFGVQNAAYHFNGTNNVISIPPSASILSVETNNELTISAWCKVEAWYNNYNVFAILERYNNADDLGWGLGLQNPATNNINCGIHFLANAISQPGVYAYVAEATTVFDHWDFYAVTFSRSSQQFKAYKNGILVGTVPTGTVEIANSTGVINIGYSPAGPDEFSHGDIDDVRLYRRALSEAEIAALYTLQSECDGLPQTIGETSAPPSTNRIYPNPGSGKFFVRGTQWTQATVVDVLGKTRYLPLVHCTNGQSTLDLSAFEKGIYFVAINGQNAAPLHFERVVVE